MRNRCKDTKDIVIESYIGANVERNYTDPNMENLNENSRVGGWIKRLGKKFEHKGEITQEEVKKFADNYFKTDTESTKIQIILAITSALGKRKDLRDLFYYKLSEIVNENMANLPDIEGGYILSRMDDGTNIYNMYQLPYSMVLQAGVMLDQDLISMDKDSDLNIKSGWFGNLIYEFMLPKNVAYKTTTPSLVKFIKSITYFNQRREAMEKEYTSSNPNAPLNDYEMEPERDKNGNIRLDKQGNIIRSNMPKKYNRNMFGLSQLYNSELAEVFNQYGQKYFKDDVALMDFIHLTMMNLIKIDKNGNAWLKTDFGKLYEGDKVIRYKDGNPIIKHHSLEPLIIKDGRIVNWNKDHRDIVKEDDKNIAGESVSQLQFNTKINPVTKKDDYDMIYELIDGIQVALWNFGHQVKFKGDEQSSRYNNLLLRAEEELSGAELAEFKTMADQMFEGELFGIHGLTQFELQEKDKHYFPKKLTVGNRTFYMSKAEENLMQNIADTQMKINQLIDDPKGNKKRIPLLRQQLFDNTRALEIISEKLRILHHGNTNFDETGSQNPIFLHNYVKNFKSVTNMIPYEAYRTDEHVVRDYISETSRQLERRGLANDLLEGFLEAKGKPKAKTYMINMFKRLFQYPDARGIIAGIPTSDDKLDRFFKKWMPGYTGKKHNINRLFKDFSALHTSTLLSGPLDGYMNYFSTMQDMVNSGKDAFFDAYSEYESNESKWENLAEKAGIITFSKYLEGYVDDILRTEDRKQAIAIKEQLMSLVEKIENHKGKIPLSQRKFYLRYKRDIDLISAQLPSKFQVIAGTLARYAINHRIETAKYEKGFSKRVKQVTGWYSRIPSIQKTEQVLRTISFIIGWKNAEKITRGFPNINEADKIQLAREYVYFTQFGLESHLVGEATGSAFTKFLNGITSFRKQRTGFDVRKNREWLRTYWNPTSLIDSLNQNVKTDKKQLYKARLAAEASAKALLNLINWRGGWSKRKKLLRQAVPSASGGDAMFLLYGAGSAFMHFVVFANPIAGGVFAAAKQWALRKNMVQAGTGFTSPYYMGILATASLSSALVKDALSDDEEDDIRFYDFYRLFRGMYGTGYMDLFSIAYGTAQATRNYIIGDMPEKRDYYNDPSKHVTFKPNWFNPVGFVRKATDTTIDFGKKWYEREKSESYRFKNY